MNPYQQFKDWTAKRKHTDIWRAVAGIIVIFFLLLLVFGSGGCVSTGPAMTLGVSHRGDGIIHLRQNIYEQGPIQVFGEYEHHSEILKEFNEDTFDAGLVGVTYQFGDWKW